MNNFINKAPYMILIGVLFGAVFSIGNAIKVLNNKAYKRFNFIKWKDKGKKGSA